MGQVEVHSLRKASFERRKSLSALNSLQPQIITDLKCLVPQILQLNENLILTSRGFFLGSEELPTAL